MKKKNFGLVLLLLSLSALPVAHSAVDGVGFTAPTISDPATNVGSNADKGDIVLDTQVSGGGFKGYNGTSWVPFSASAATVTTPSATSPVVVSAYVTSGGTVITKQQGGAFASCDKVSSQTGNYYCNFTTSYWASTPICSANSASSISGICNAQPNGTGSIDIDCFEPFDGSPLNMNYTIICHGEKL